uniref:Uncharacterized protein n=1 Tax=Anguilla anguilla TaxID=7936 RepID=A0A0E9VLL6_ANGAN
MCCSLSRPRPANAAETANPVSISSASETRSVPNAGGFKLADHEQTLNSTQLLSRIE